ncbi:hypothetical protein CBR_g30302 [Chara braunii]|uniref:Uncharacterized protein n=1 Tax=Chara braunii TaxID=69332 RepID=A0A388JX47_CHABU|nr:hypothetical protein CBR_g30302 [Chara braunii]|eukprot:GBG62348.1 hypothetical protein CBR_g30302 [Chara braunii]
MSSAMVETPSANAAAAAPLPEDDLTKEEEAVVQPILQAQPQAPGFFQRIEEEATAMGLKIQETWQKGVVEKLKKPKKPQKDEGEEKDKDKEKEENSETQEVKAPGFFQRMEEEVLAVRQKVQEKIAELRNRRNSDEKAKAVQVEAADDQAEAAEAKTKDAAKATSESVDSVSAEGERPTQAVSESPKAEEAKGEEQQQHKE